MKSWPKTTETVPDIMAGLQLDRYLVDDLVFKCNNQVVAKKDELANRTISIDFNVKENTKNKNLFLLEMQVDLNEGKELNKVSMYQIHLHLLGWLRFTTTLDTATKNKMLYTNGSAMLYGVARSVVANLTGSLGPERYILPTLNLLAVIKAKTASRPEIAKAPATVIAK